MISNKISGWYYDLQLNNRLTCATLHPNMELSEDQTKWIPCRTTKTMLDSDKDNPESEYREEPICRAIINEDFNVSVANSWSDFGGDMLGQIWESVKPLAPYADAFQNMIAQAVKDYNDPNNKEQVDKINESFVSKTMANLMEAANNAMNNGKIDITDYLNRSLVAQGTRFSYYSGSGTSFGNLMMKFTLFPTYDEKKGFVTVDDQVDKLFPYCIGKFVKGTDGLDESFKSEEGKELQKAIDNMIGWQKPPGGFKANVKNVDVVQDGTLLLKFGAYYSIANLVVENANFNFSKQMVKNPNINSAQLISPLYCDITIQLRPATKYSDISLRKFVLSRWKNKTVQDVIEDLRKNLNYRDTNSGLNSNSNSKLYVY